MRGQPFLHDLSTCVAAPASVLSGRDGQLRPLGAQGFLVADVRHLSELTVRVDGEQPDPLGHKVESAARTRFAGAARHLGDPIAEPTVRVERDRQVEPDRLLETIVLVNDSRQPISTTLSVVLAADLAPILEFRAGRATAPVAPRQGTPIRWVAGDRATTATAWPEPDRLERIPDHVRLEWDLRLDARSSTEITLEIVAAGDAVFPPPPTRDLGAPAVTSHEPELDRLVAAGLDDLGSLLLADGTNRFAGAGAPWYLTLFGRDSLWAARFALPLGTDLVLGTLRTLASRQGTRHDPETAEQPGKLPHEIRAGSCYYGTIDATPLWLSLLHDAWRWGLPAADLEPLLPAAHRALDWILSHGNGFLAYRDESSSGLSNQGWKDSTDSIQDSAGTLAPPPVALCEAQAYAYRAVLDTAALLDAFGQPGATRAREYAADLQVRFRDAFWGNDFPALALDGTGRRADALTSNLGHLLGTGLLSTVESAKVAALLGDPRLDSGYGLRTFDADHPYFNPVGYHTGTVWPHDTAIAVAGLARDGHHGVAASLATGLVRAGTHFGHRLPELFGVWAGTPLDYPSACRPQAWSAAAGLVLLRVALGLAADVPAGRLTVAPAPEFAAWFPLRVSGLAVAGHELTIDVDRDGRPTVHTGAPLQVAATR